MQDLAGKNFVITGANSGIGRITARELARRGARILMACRSLERARPAADELIRETGNSNIEVVSLDLSDLASVRRCAEDILARNIPIHGLVNNAGMTAGLRGDKTQTKDGFEPTFQANHLGHYLLTRLLLDRIKTTPGARIVNVSSHSHYLAKKLDWNRFRKKPSLTGLSEYNASKLANVLFTKELARRLAGTGVTVYAVHPGQVATNIWQRLPGFARKLFTRRMLTPEQGAVSSIRAAAAPEAASETGLYYDEHGKQKHPSRVSQNPELAQELWRKSAEWTGLPE